MAKKLSDGGKELYNLFIEKWRLIVEISLNRATESDVHNFLQDCRRLENSQSDRDVMFHWALQTRDQQMMQKVYVGTPFKDYRRVIASEVPELSELATVAWNGSFFEHQWESRFEVSRKSSSGISLSKNELRLMKALLEDFFEAKSVGSVFESLFPDEFLDPEFSLGKTYKVIQRLNRKFSIVGVGFNVNNDSLKYNLVIPEGWMVLARNPDATVVNGEALGFDESELTIKFQNRPFDRKDVEQEFDLSRSSAVRWLKSLRERKVIKKLVRGQAVSTDSQPSQKPAIQKILYNN